MYCGFLAVICFLFATINHLIATICTCVFGTLLYTCALLREFTTGYVVVASISPLIWYVLLKLVIMSALTPPQGSLPMARAVQPYVNLEASNGRPYRGSCIQGRSVGLCLRHHFAQTVSIICTNTIQYALLLREFVCAHYSALQKPQHITERDESVNVWEFGGVYKR